MKMKKTNFVSLYRLMIIVNKLSKEIITEVIYAYAKIILSR
jgi:hypothetical protein